MNGWMTMTNANMTMIGCVGRMDECRGWMDGWMDELYGGTDGWKDGRL